MNNVKEMILDKRIRGITFDACNNRIIKAVRKTANLGRLMVSIAEWQDETFGESRTAIGALNHMRQELEEIAVELQEGNMESLSEELADVFFMWTQLVDVCEVDIENAIQSKLHKNKARKWKKPTAEGVINHVE